MLTGVRYRSVIRVVRCSRLMRSARLAGLWLDQFPLAGLAHGSLRIPPGEVFGCYACRSPSA